MAFVALAVNGLLASYYLGYDEGYQKAFELYNSGTLFSTTPILQTIFPHYLLSMLFIGFIVGKIIRRELFSSLICLASLFGASLVYFRWLTLLTTTEIGFLGSLQYNVSILDGLSLVITVTLTVLQTITVFQDFSHKRTRTLDTF